MSEAEERHHRAKNALHDDWSVWTPDEYRNLISDLDAALGKAEELAAALVIRWERSNDSDKVWFEGLYEKATAIRT